MMHNAAEHDDLRVRRTRMLIRQAFLDLMVEMGFAALTVRDITERAMINRSTFYRHYLDKYDLLDHYLDELAALVHDPPDIEVFDPNEVPTQLVALLTRLQEHAALHRALVAAITDPLVAARFHQKARRHFLSCYGAARTEDDVVAFELKYTMTISAGSRAINWWLAQQPPYPTETFARWLNAHMRELSVSSPPH